MWLCIPGSSLSSLHFKLLIRGFPSKLLVACANVNPLSWVPRTEFELWLKLWGACQLFIEGETDKETSLSWSLNPSLLSLSPVLTIIGQALGQELFLIYKTRMQTC